MGKRSAEFEKNRRNLLAEIKRCEFCGDPRGLEVHHSIPLSLGGSDEEDNLIVCCAKCHGILHRGNHSQLTKIGLKKLRDTKKLSRAFYKFVEDLDYKIEIADVFDFIEEYDGGEP